MTNIIFFDKILLALKKCGELNIALIFSWRSTQVAEEAPLLRVYVVRAARGFKSLLLRSDNPVIYRVVFVSERTFKNWFSCVSVDKKYQDIVLKKHFVIF